MAPLPTLFHTLATMRTLRHPLIAPLNTLRTTLCIAASALLLAACATPHADNASLDAALAGPQRSDAAKARDVYRHPKETLQFFTVASTQRVLEIAPGGGWYTEILAPYLHDRGTLYEAEYASPSADSAAEEHTVNAVLARKLAGTPALYSNVIVGTLQNGRFSFPVDGTIDRVLTFRNIHNWIKDGQIDANLRAFYAALKQGGELGVEEHRATPGTSLQQIIDSGYVTEDYVIAHARAAGFELLARSEINANPRDTKDYPHGVWSLPPTYQGGATDRARYAAIGESDRMTLTFIKPAAH